MRLNKRGAALLQVLIISAVLAGLSTMVLRATLSRTVMARQTRKTVSAQLLIESCMAQVNTLWAAKLPEVYANDLSDCRMCSEESVDSCEEGSDRRTMMCTVPHANGGSYSVRADMSKVGGKCQIEYTVIGGVSSL